LGRISHRPRSILHGLIGLAMIPSLAHAIGFGEMVGQSAIGEPFRAEFKLFGVGANENAECLRVVATSTNDGIPQLRNAQVRMQRKGQAMVAVVTRSTPVSDPIIRVTLEEICSARLQRTYTLLLPMAATMIKTPAAPSPSAPPPPAPDKPSTLGSGDLGGAYTLARPTSINQLARQLFPGSRADRAAFISALRKTNAGDRSLRSTRHPLATGTTLILPTPAEIERARADQLSRAKSSQPAAAPSAPARAVAARPNPSDATLPDEATDRSPAPSAGTPSDRLVLAGDTPESSGFKLSSRLGNPDLINSTTEAERALLRREQQILMAVDAQIMTRMALSERIARLEALQNVLKAEMAVTEGGGSEPVPESSPPAEALTQTAPAASQTRTAPAADTAPRPSVTSTQETNALEISVSWWPVAAAGAALLLVGALWWRRRPAPPAYEDEMPAETTPSASETLAPPTMKAPEETIPEGLPGQGDSFDFSVIEWDGPPPAELDHSIAPIALDEQEMAEEHESAVELADIMMSFGRVQGAAETLAEFIRGNPKKAVQPWIKLLEVYKAADMRAEFDALTHKLNQTFNVKTVTWESFDEIKKAPDSVEQMPHIINGLKDQWMTVDCQRYVQMLLRDNRGGTREGFPLGVVDDLLLLQAVLEDALGPYRPSEEEIAAALGGSGSKDAEARQSDPNGFVAPPAELAPELSFDDKRRETPPTSIDESDIFDLDGPQERTELPDLDFQLDSDFLADTDSTDAVPENAAPEDDQDAQKAMRATWVMPKPKDTD